MIRRFLDRFVGRNDTPPEPLRPGQAIDGRFEFKDRSNGGRYDAAKAYRRSFEIQEARRKLGLDADQEELRLPEDYMMGPVPRSVQQSMLERGNFSDPARR